MATKMISIVNAVEEYGIPKKTLESAISNFEINAYKLQDRTRYFKRTELDKGIDTKVCNKSIPLFRSKFLPDYEAKGVIQSQLG